MPRVTELWAWVMADSGPDDEGVPAVTDGLLWRPLIGADRERAESLRDDALLIARMAGKPIKLVRSTGPLEVVEVIEP
jgi:hypothetical protein